MKILLVSLFLVLFFLSSCTGGVPTTMELDSTELSAAFTRMAGTLPPAAALSPAATYAPVETVGPALPARLTATIEVPKVSEEVIAPINAQALEVSAQVSQAGANSFIWLPTGQGIVLTTENGLALYNRGAAAQAVGLVQAERPFNLVFSAPLEALAWTGRDHSIYVWSLPEQRMLQTIANTQGAVTSLAFSPQTGRLAAATGEGQLQIWDASSGNLVSQWRLPGWITNLAFSPDGRLLGGADPANFLVHLLDASTGQLVRSLEWKEHASPALYGAYFSPDWSRVAWASRATIHIASAAAQEQGLDLLHEDFVSAVSWSPDGQMLASAAAATINGSFQPAVILWEAVTGRQVGVFAQPGAVLSLSFSADGRELAVLLNGGSLNILQVGQ
ncbi:MAG: hypothetical protein JXB15_06010 [Anaerolineales bacterium]|nr:hypothetical protein [Anaerolineales bacterium]